MMQKAIHAAAAIQLRRAGIAILVLFLSAGLRAQNSFIPPALSNDKSWTMIMLPDPQTYNKFGRNQPLFDLMTAWIGDNIQKLNIKLVICTGDLVEQNEMVNPDGINGDQPSKKQWEAVSRAFERIDGKVPYILAAGNHDFGYSNISVRKSNFNKYFPVDKNWQTQQLVREVTLNTEAVPTLENAAYEFISPGNRKFLFFSLE